MAERLYVVGHPVAHSKSPAMHNAAYQAMGLDWLYDLADCPTRDAAEAFLGRIDWLALNITMPYKPLALSVADEASEEACLAKGANVLIRHQDKLIADNTDGKGCISYLKRCGVCFGGSSAVVCGTGPTSLAIVYALVSAGAAEVRLLGRDGEKAQRALRDLRQCASQSDVVLDAGSYEESRDAISRANIIVDATPLGMQPNDPAPFDTSLLDASQTVFDVVYGHGLTKLVSDARAAGCAAYDGAGMLVAQAVETVLDISRTTGAFEVPESLDLFSVMARGAGFDLQR